MRRSCFRSSGRDGHESGNGLREVRSIFIYALITSGFFFLLSPEIRAGEPVEFAAGEILLKFKETTQTSEKTAFEKEFGLVLLRESGATGVCLYQSKEENVLIIIDKIIKNKNIEFAEPNYVQKNRSIPNDPLYSNQWYLPKIGMPTAWSEFTGTGLIKIAVVDSGVSKYHDEITPILSSEGEWDYVSGDSDANDEGNTGHGTLVAGIIAAVRNNNTGISGVCSSVRIVPFRTSDENGSSFQSDSAAAIERAAEYGCKVINCSFGGSYFSNAQNAAINYANLKGALVVCSGGNESINNDSNPHYPSNYTQANVISVASSISTDALSPFSNYGASSVDISAPGTGIFSTQARKKIAEWRFDNDWDGWDEEIVSGLGFFWGSTGLGLYTLTNGGFYQSDSSIVLYSPLFACTEFEKVKIKAKFEGGLGIGDSICIYVYDSQFNLHDENWIRSSGDLERDEGWTFESAYLPKKSGRFSVYFVSDGIFNDFFGLINAEVIGFSTNPVVTSQLFESASGTSFSAPVVAGVAAMLMSQNPQLTHLQVKDIILQTARKVSALNGKVVCGGIVDAAAALREAKARVVVTPAITSSTSASGTVGSSFSYSITASGTPTSYNASSLPPGLSVNTSTGVISGTPSSAGTFTSSISASNIAGTGSATVSVTVSKATPVISNVPTSRPIVVGQALSNSVLSKGVASVPGTWAWISPTNRPGSGTSLQPVTFTPTASNNFNTVTTNVSLTVNLSTTLITRVPNPGPITFGQALSNSVLSNGVASVPGSWAWQSPTNLPNAGSNRPNIVFTPSNRETHTSITTNIALTVNKGTPQITWSNLEAITFGTALSSTQLNATSPVAGSYSYLPTNGSVLNARTNNLVLTFRATDSNNYVTPVTRTNPLVVNKATPMITNRPTASAIVFGQALRNSVLSGGSNAVRGKWGWATPTNRPSAVGTNNFSIIFTPSDSLNLNQVTSNVSLIINQATPVITRMPTASRIAYGQSLSNSVLSNGVASVMGVWSWTSPTNRPSAGTNRQGITFTPSNSINVRSIFTNVLLRVNQHVVNHVFGSATQSFSTVNGFVASFKRVGSVGIGFAPSPGQVLTLINNTSSNQVVGEFEGLPEGATITTTYGGNTFYFRISYAGGDGNDITLKRIGAPGQQEGYIVTTFAGSGRDGLTNGIGTNASIGGPSGIALDGLGYVYVSSGSVIRKITPLGEVTTLAGSGFPGADDGPGNTARFDTPKGLAVDQNGNVYVADWYNQRIRKVTADGFVSTLAGQRREGFIDGTGTNASFYYPSGLALDTERNIYVTEQGNHAVRKVTAEGVVTTLAGSGVAGFTNGEGTSASFNYPTGVSVDDSGNAYVADQLNDRIRKISPSGVVTTFAGASPGSYWDDMATNALFSFPSGVACDSAGDLYIADENRNRICKIDSNGRLRTIAGLGGFGYADGYGTDAKFAHPSAIALDRSGIIFVADTLNHRIRKISATNEYRPIFTAYNWSTLIGQNDQQLAKVNPNGFATTVKFFYGTNSNNMNLLATLPIAPRNGTVPLTVTSPVVRLTQGITNYYRFTASNVDGLSVTPVLSSLLPYTNATLTKLVTSSGSLNPVFSTLATNYTLSVSNTNSSLRITPTLAGPYSWISVFGTNIPSGTVSGPIPLEVGTNAISIYVNAQNRTTTSIYTLNVIRAASP